MEPLVSTEWLAAELGAPDLRIVETTVWLRRTPEGYETVSGRPDWERAHIPGSAFADLLSGLADPDTPLPCMAPDDARFAAGMEALGIGEGTRVVVYDRTGSPEWSTRLWWMLRAYGFDAAAVLDGGWRAWTGEGRPVTAEPPPARPPTRFVVRRRPWLFATKEEVLAAIGDGATCIVNALSREQHRGDDVGYPRRGHIPGAWNVPAAELVDPETSRYLPRAELEARLAEMLAKPRVITYCGGGIAATSDAFVLTLLGHTNVAVYDGSLLEWASDPTLPLEVDSDHAGA